MFIPRLIDSVKTGKAVVLQGEEGIKINPIYVHDAAKAIACIIQKDGSFNVNIGGSEIVSIKGICELIGQQLNLAPLFEYQTSEVKNLIGDISKMKTIYTPSVNIEQGLKKCYK